MTGVDVLVRFGLLLGQPAPGTAANEDAGLFQTSA
jgi:hypothetical protein